MTAFVITASKHNLHGIPCNLNQTLFGDFGRIDDAFSESSRDFATLAEAEAALAQLETSGDWTDERPDYEIQRIDSIGYARMKAGDRVVCAEAQTEGRMIRTTVTIDGDLYESETIEAGSGWTDCETEASTAARRTAEMLDAGMIRRTGDDWELADNAEWPVPAGWVAEWKEAR